MLKKILIQIFLIILIIVISISFYLKYFNKNDKANQNEKEIVELEITKGNVISDIVYESQDFEGRQYIIKSLKGVVDKDNRNIIEMENVDARIIFLDGTFISITSNYAVYDNIKFNTKFNKNITIQYLDHLIKSEDLILSFEKNQLEAFNNLTYENLDLIMLADKIIFDFKSKNTKVFNFDNSNVKIKSK